MAQDIISIKQQGNLKRKCEECGKVGGHDGPCPFLRFDDLHALMEQVNAECAASLSSQQSDSEISRDSSVSRAQDPSSDPR